MENVLHIVSLEEAKKELMRLKETSHVQVKNWGVAEICLHCAQTIEYAMVGYPVMKPALIRGTIGKIAIRKFLSQGYMKHNLSAHVEGGSKLDSDVDDQEGIQKLLDTIDLFQAYTRELKPHLLFGRLSKSEYDQYFAMHIADHLNELEY